MSEGNVEIVRNGFAAAMRQDWERAAELIDPSIEMHGTVSGLEQGRVARGLPEIVNSFEADDLEAWQERRLEPQTSFTSTISSSSCFTSTGGAHPGVMDQGAALVGRHVFIWFGGDPIDAIQLSPLPYPNHRCRAADERVGAPPAPRRRALGSLPGSSLRSAELS
jgi:hypothetical protein